MTHEMTVEVSGRGKTKDDAFADAISKLQPTISKKISGTLIRIEPLSVDFVEGVESQTTEKLFFLFMKRVVSVFTLKLSVSVRVFSVEVDKFPFSLEKKSSII